MSTAPVKRVPAKAARPRRITPVAVKVTATPAAAPPVAPAPRALAPTAAASVAKVASTPAPQSEPKASIKPVTAKPAKPLKVKKPKFMRGSFTIPETEYAVLQELKQRAARLTRVAKKSELIRAGIKALAALPDAVFMDALLAVSAIPARRSKKARGKGK